jgi:ABC-type uncharacterized transport system auxiliary subunit
MRGGFAGRRLLSLLGLGTLVVGLAGCASGPAPVDHYYRIDVRSPANRSAHRLAGNLQVDRLRVDALAGERHILYRSSGDASEIRQHPYHRWSDPPAILIQTALVSYLDSAEVAEVVMTATARVQPDFVISGRLSRFEQVLDPSVRVVVELQLTLTSSDGRVLVNERYQEERGPSSSDVAASADAFAEAVNGIFGRFLADLSASAAASP